MSIQSVCSFLRVRSTSRIMCGRERPWSFGPGPTLVKTLLVITSKVFTRVGPGPNDQGLSRPHIMREVERTLKKLQTDWIDIYYLHNVDPETTIEETLRAVEDLVRQGKVRYVGASNH